MEFSVIDARDEKRAQRKAALAKRDAISDALRQSAADSLFAQIGSLDLPAAAVVSGYWPIRSERDPRPALAMLRTAGHPIVLPVVTGERTIEFREWLEDAPLIEAGFGTKGPKADARALDPEVLLIPMAAFDRTGNRIGYGAGFYDTAIERLETVRPVMKIGIGFSAQEVPAVATEDHDAVLDFVMTENEWIDCRRRSGAE